MIGPWVVTGDRFRRDADGYFWYEGRSDDMLKVGANWVSPVEVENVLLGHPAVAECAVVGQADGHGLIRPKAFVVPKSAYAPEGALADALLAHATSRLPPFKRPSWIEFRDELPKTATGKIRRFLLRG
jgi:acyl-coenzyme A synthetase/AMP-(fatty) acid ligase